MLKFIALSLLTIFLFSFDADAQRFRYGVNAGTGTVRCWFPVESDFYSQAEIETFQSKTFGASVAFKLTQQTRIVTGMKYLSVEGQNSAGRTEAVFVFPNGTGDLNMSVDNAYLIFPIEVQILISRKNVRPVIATGLNFFKPLKESITMVVTPDNYDPASRDIGSTFDNKDRGRYFGAFVAAGVNFKISEHHELQLMLYQHMNNSVYRDANGWDGKFKKHQIRFNVLELNLGYTFR